jgi:Integrase core domain
LLSRVQRGEEIEPGKPQEKESFNGRLRGECLNEHVFSSLAETRRMIEAWRVDCTPRIRSGEQVITNSCWPTSARTPVALVPARTWFANLPGPI